MEDKYMVVCIDLGNTCYFKFLTKEAAKAFLDEVNEDYINTFLCEILERGHDND
jgi:predicted small metal-binding protein